MANFCAYPSFVEEHTLGKIAENHRLFIYIRHTSVNVFRARYAVGMEELQLFRILVVFRGTVVYCTYIEKQTEGRQRQREKNLGENTHTQTTDPERKEDTKIW